MPLNRFSVPTLATLTRELAAVAAGRAAPELVLTGARVLSTYSERLHREREVWVHRGRIAAVRPAGTCPRSSAGTVFHDVGGGIIAPGLVDPHLHIESSMMTACAYAEGALLNGTTTVFCDSHEIGNVLDVAGIEMMLEDARQAPLSVYLTVPSTVPATTPLLETAGGDLTAEKIGALFDPRRWRWARRWTSCRCARATNAATRSLPRRSRAGGRCAGTSTGGSSWRRTRPAG